MRYPDPEAIPVLIEDSRFLTTSKSRRGVRALILPVATGIDKLVEASQRLLRHAGKNLLGPRISPKSIASVNRRGIWPELGGISRLNGGLQGCRNPWSRRLLSSGLNAVSNR